ncbi:MAG: choline dehydrogenase [Rhodospirillaceae bacterium]|jgi:choline dehydrogenase|nr:choline dehydrogenase [Rhodospirillaceae bacterium]
MESFDYIIVGAGSAGCVLANRLSADPGVSVCLLEAGPPDWNPYIHIPAGFIKTFTAPSVNWLYEMEPSEGTGGRRIGQPRGKTLGGSSSINGHAFTRGNRTDFDHWAQRGNRGWGYADVLPYFRRLENRVGAGDDTFRGRDGPLTVTNMDWHHPLCEAFVEGAQELGIPRNLDYNGAKQEGVSYTQRAIAGGRRMSTARAFLHPVKHRPNLRVITRAHSTGLIMDGKSVTGVRYAKGGRGGKEIEISAGREVILSGGAINSPQLLQTSGIGPVELLQSLGVEVRHALEGVGENLRDHYAMRLSARVKNADSINEQIRGVRFLGELAKWVFARKGVLSLNPTLVYCFWRSRPEIDISDLHMAFTPASYKEGMMNDLEDYPGMTAGVWQQRPESSGYLRACSADPFEQPLIQPNYLADENDRRVLIAGARLMRSLLRTDAMAPYFDYETFPGDAVQSDDEWLDAIKGRGTTVYHLMGTCRMGPVTDPTAVVDDELRVHGVQGLRVVDASVMPMMPSGNLNASTIMIAEKASDMIRGATPPEPIILPDND